MTADATADKTLVIKNIGRIVSGDLNKGVLDGDTLVIKKGKIINIGGRGIIPQKIDITIDAKGTTIIPGLIDSHTHPYLSDWTPRLEMKGWMEKCVQAGVTTMISQGEVHIPGGYNDGKSAKALAILARKVYETFRPGGLKVDGGPIILGGRLDKNDFSELKKMGVWRVAEIGGAGLYKYKDIKEMLALAKKFGMKISVHCGAPSQRPDSANMTAKDILKINPDILVHVNGGSTAPSTQDVEKLINQSKAQIEIVHNSNIKMMIDIVKLAKELNCLDRIIIGSDSPTGRGIMITAILNVITWVSSLAGINPVQAIAMATGNTAEAFGFNTGKIEKGRAADLVLMDAPVGSAALDALESFQIGDSVGVAQVIIDGEVVVEGSKFTAPPQRMPKIIKK